MVGRGGGQLDFFLSKMILDKLLDRHLLLAIPLPPPQQAFDLVVISPHPICFAVPVEITMKNEPNTVSLFVTVTCCMYGRVTARCVSGSLYREWCNLLKKQTSTVDLLAHCCHVC